MPVLLTFGDSNTYGSPPGEDTPRFPPDIRWPGVCLRQLGPQWSLVEEGLPGRTTRHPDPEMGPHMDGRIGLLIALQSHGPIDVMTLMLGTNDLKSQFDVGPDGIADDIATLLDIALSQDMQDRHGGFQILLICPAPILEQGPFADQFGGGREKSHQLPAHFADVAAARGVAFLDAGTVVESSAEDGIHLDADMHERLGMAVAAKLAEMNR